VRANAKIAALLKQAMGLDVATVGQTALDHAVRARMAHGQDGDVESYWQRLQESEGELQELIEAVVVPETWFFRDREAFTALGRIIAEEWAPAHPGALLRALSLPCSSGEEPYSLVMTLLDAGLSPHRFQVDAVDISARALARARRAVYERNSFRGEELDYRERHFTARQDRYELQPAIREHVRFQRGNLLAADFLAGAEPYDVIFCRNVLIYFDAPTQERVIALLARMLAPDGTLFVGPSEAFLVRRTGLVSAEHPRAFAYRKTGSPGLRAEAAPRKKIKRTPAAAAKAAPKPAALPARKVRPEPAPAGQAAPDLELISRLADAGRLQEAARACEAHLKEHGASPGAYYLWGLVHDANGHPRRAAECYRKVIYLEPNHAEALTHLALLAGKQGDAAAAKRLQRRAQRVEETLKS
jgi:chemotaxis protein methyltransferase WspC